MFGCPRVTRHFVSEIDVVLAVGIEAGGGRHCSRSTVTLGRYGKAIPTFEVAKCVAMSDTCDGRAALVRSVAERNAFSSGSPYECVNSNAGQ